MSRSAPPLSRQLLLGHSRALVSARDVAQWLAVQVQTPDRARVGGVVLLEGERWLCFMEGPSESVELLAQDIALHLKPRLLQLLMTDQRARARLFGQHALGCRHPSTPLEMVALVADIHRHGGKTQEWHCALDECVNLLVATEL